MLIDEPARMLVVLADRLLILEGGPFADCDFDKSELTCLGASPPTGPAFEETLILRPDCLIGMEPLPAEAGPLAEAFSGINSAPAKVFRRFSRLMGMSSSSSSTAGVGARIFRSRNDLRVPSPARTSGKPTTEC